MTDGGGGGGSGWFGGGQGSGESGACGFAGYAAGGGGGGSSHVNGAVTAAYVTPGARAGNGLVVISYAKPAPAAHTVTFQPGNGTDTFTQTVKDGAAATEPTAPSRQGYTFTGWYTAKSGGTGWDFSTPVTGDLTLYGQWTATSAEPAPTPPVTAGPVADQQPGLASTGVEVSTLLYWALPMLLVGGLAIAVTRRRRTRNAR
ncbi:hypothetical protein GTY80_22685 [Amycolatopsis sp. SID8362]|nr:InlB B-repeat-containing protein [Amycolatopsis sp. SID8362]NBH06043.1 hypothetical protein [Amycolatopsis sp. SID8362]NED42742.1 InlB B-repeat-containing protein [Amycolatopsis sp. SID8362]